MAYADPPYPGQSHRHYRDHPDYAGEVDRRTGGYVPRPQPEPAYS
jgi:hypothetical protein